MNMPLVLLNRRRRGFTAFSPSTLFALAEPGVWFDPSDLTTLFQDPAGTTPVTAPGNTVGLMLDKSRGLALGTELVANGDFSNGSTGWTLGALWTVSDAQLVGSNVASGTYATSPSFSVVTGTFYRVSLTTTVTSGSFSVRFDNGGTETVLGTVSASGSHTFYVAAPDASSVVGLRALASGFTGTVDNISVRELAGNHATQATLAARPTYSIEPVGGRRNLLTQTEAFNESDWQKYAMSVTANAGTAPNGTLTADLIYPSSSTTDNSIYRGGFPTVQKTHSVYAKASGKNWLVILKEGTLGGAAWFDLANGVVGTTSAGYTGATITSVGSGWYRCSVTSTSGFSQYIAFGAVDADNTTTVTASGTNGIFLWGAQLELGSTATPYQRVTTQHDVTEAGVASLGYLYFDGVNDAMATSTITPGIDKAQVFAGVRKLSDAAIGTLIETGIDVSSASYPGSLALFAPSGAGVASYQTFFRGAVGRNFETITTFAAPVSNVVTFSLSNQLPAAGDAIQSRANGVAVTATESSNITTAGNFGNWPMYLGGRAGTSLFFVGHLYSLITRFGPTLDAPTISNTETWVAGKTGIVI